MSVIIDERGKENFINMLDFSKFRADVVIMGDSTITNQEDFVKVMLDYIENDFAKKKEQYERDNIDAVLKYPGHKCETPEGDLIELPASGVILVPPQKKIIIP